MRQAETMKGVIANAIFVEARPVFVLIHVVRVGHLRQEPPRARCKRVASEEPFNSGAELGWRVGGNSAKELLALIAEVGAEERQQLNHHFVGDFAWDVPPPTRATAWVADLPERVALRGHALVTGDLLEVRAARTASAVAFSACCLCSPLRSE